MSAKVGGAGDHITDLLKTGQHALLPKPNLIFIFFIKPFLFPQCLTFKGKRFLYCDDIYLFIYLLIYVNVRIYSNKLLRTTQTLRESIV